MKTTLGALALAAVATLAAAALLRNPPPHRAVFLSPWADRQEPAAGGVTVRGRVVHGGEAVAGASVRFMSLEPGPRPALVTSPQVFKSQADASGRFELSGVPAGPGRLAVVADRLAPFTTTLDLDSTTDLTIALEAGFAMEGVVETGGTPVAGSRVSLRVVGSEFMTDRRPLRESVTDSEGRYRLEGLDPARPVRLVVLAEGHRPYEKSFRNPTEGPPRIDLDPGVQIVGRVVTAAGDPVADAEVLGSQGEAYVAETRSGPSGEIRLGGLVSRPVAIRILVEGYGPARLELPSPSSGWTIVLRRNGGLAGRASAGSWLVVETSGATYRRALPADGSFRWEGLPAGPGEARATDGTGRVLAVRKVEIPEGEVADGILLAP